MMPARPLWNDEPETSSSSDSGVRRIASLAEPEPPSARAPKRRVHEVSAEETIDFRCVVCARASFGEQCPCCGGEVCTAHDDFLYKWCARCEAGYGAQRGALERVLVTFAVGTLVGCVALLGIAQQRHDVFLRGFIAAALLAWVILTVAGVAARVTGRWQYRAQHARERQTYFG